MKKKRRGVDGKRRKERESRRKKKKGERDKKKSFTPAGNRTRDTSVGGLYDTTTPLVLT